MGMDSPELASYQLPNRRTAESCSRVRLSDLISFIRLGSSQLGAQPGAGHLSDELRLMLLKSGFPRRDLLAWVDDAGLVGVPPPFYLPFLLVGVAAQIAVRNERIYEVSCARSEELTSLHAFPRPAGAQAVRWSLTDDGTIADPAAPPLHQIGLVDGFFSDARQLESFRYCLDLGPVSAYKVFLMTAEFYQSWRSVDPAGPCPSEIFCGTLQYWGTQQIYLLYMADKPLSQGNGSSNGI